MRSSSPLRRLIDRLRGFDGAGALVVSLYLDLDPVRQVDRSYRIVVKDLLRDARERLPDAWHPQLQAEEKKILAWVDDVIPAGTGVAVFSCNPRGLWLAQFLPTPVGDHLSVSPEPDIGPLLEVPDGGDRFAVALVDKEHARILDVVLGAVLSVEELDDGLDDRHRHGDAAQARLQRRQDSQTRGHLKRVAQRLAAMVDWQTFDRLIIAGPVEAASGLREILPRRVAERLVAVEHLDIRAGEEEVRRLVNGVADRLAAEAERALVEQELAAAMARHLATRGLTTTLEAIWRRQVQTLLVGAPARPTGSDCTECGWLDPKLLATCPACGSPMRPVTDLVAVAMSHTLDQAGTVEVVHGDAARRLDEVGKGIAALLRARVNDAAGQA